MGKARAVWLVIVGFIVVAGGIMAAIYLLGGGEGDSVNIPDLARTWSV